MIVERGYRPAGNYHTVRLMNAPLGHFFTVMTHGYGAMPEYSAQVSPQDRWAIVAYIKALQLSQSAKPADAPPGARIESLATIAESEGLPANFANEWTLPPTAVYGTPNNQDNGIPPELPPSANGKYPGAQSAPAQPNASASPNKHASPNKQ
jgi:hypothetical protein